MYLCVFCLVLYFLFPIFVSRFAMYMSMYFKHVSSGLVRRLILKRYLLEKHNNNRYSFTTVMDLYKKNYRIPLENDSHPFTYAAIMPIARRFEQGKLSHLFINFIYNQYMYTPFWILFGEKACTLFNVLECPRDMTSCHVFRVH